MRLLFVFTGGTIGSTADGDYTGIDADKPHKLTEAYRDRFGIDFDYDTVDPVTFLSENNDGLKITAVIGAVCSRAGDGYDGIIVTHGTDTIRYTAAAAGYCLGNASVPVCFVSSDLPIEDERSNGLINLHHAIEYIGQGLGRGCTVVYRNRGADHTQVHRATRLLAHSTYSSGLFSSHDLPAGRFDDLDGFTPDPAYTELSDEITPFGGLNLGQHCEAVMRISPYPGMVYPAVPDMVRYIIHESFHSGTVNTEDAGYRGFFDEMYDRGIQVYITGAAEGKDYESTKMYDKMHVIRTPGIAPAALYMKLWLTHSAGADAKEVIPKSLGGDICRYGS